MYVIRPVSSALRGPCYLVPWSSNFTRKLEPGGLGGKVYALSDMADHVTVQRGPYAPSVDLSTGALLLEDCGPLFRHLDANRAITWEYSDPRKRWGMTKSTTCTGSGAWGTQQVDLPRSRAIWPRCCVYPDEDIFAREHVDRGTV